MSMQQPNEFAPAVAQPTSGTQMMVGRQSQEVQAAIFLAKQFPRDENASFTKIMTACKRKRLAEEAEYEFPRGGSKVTGPSIRLAEVVAQHWGNIDYGIMELEQKAGKSEVMAYAWDLETNTRRSMTFTVSHIRSTKKGNVALDDPRDIYEMVANQGSRRVRACILGVIPGDVIDAAVDECRKTIVSGNTEPLKDRIRKMLVRFETEYQVTQAMLEKYVGCSIDAISENDYIRLGNVYKSLRDGMAKREAYFEIPNASSDSGKSKAEEEFEAAQRYAAGGDHGEPSGTGKAQAADAANEPELSFE